MSKFTDRGAYDRFHAEGEPMLTTTVKFLDEVELEVFSEEPFTERELDAFRMLTSVEFKILLRIEFGPAETSVH